MMALDKKFEHLKIKLEAIKSATNNFSDANCIGRGGFGNVYKGELIHSGGRTTVALKQLDRKFGQGDPEFWKEIIMLSLYKHKNVVSLLGFCDDSGQKILVYEYASKRSLDRFLKSDDLTWVRRLNICIGAARGLAYLHNPGETQQRVLHRDIKSSNILLDENWNARISDFGLSKFGPANQQYTFLVSAAVGTLGYCDPLYVETGILTKESDVYSFGVVLFEVFCGRLCIDNNNKSNTFTTLVQQAYEQNKVDEIVYSNMKERINSHSLDAFTTIAYQCLNMDYEQRPLMTQVVRDLENALRYQVYGDDSFTGLLPDKKTDISTGELLSIDPYELQFPYDLTKEVSISTQLVNKTDSYVAFKVKTTKPEMYAALPNLGILFPRSCCDIILTMQPHKEAPNDMESNDKYLLQSAVVSHAVAPKDITREMFNKESGNQVEECILNVSYVEENFSQRLSISDNGALSYVNSNAASFDLSTGKLLNIEPQELQFPFELKKKVSISLQLKNKTDSHVAYKVKTTRPEKYVALPNSGILLPHSTSDVIFTMQAPTEAPHDMHCNDKYLLQSAVVSPRVAPKDITREMFNKESGNQVEEYRLNINYVTPAEPPSPVKEARKKVLTKTVHFRHNDYNINEEPQVFGESHHRSSS